VLSKITVYFSEILIAYGIRLLLLKLLDLDLKDAPEGRVDMIVSTATSQVHYCSHLNLFIINIYGHDN
jgi:hypothetical protein